MSINVISNSSAVAWWSSDSLSFSLRRLAICCSFWSVTRNWLVKGLFDEHLALWDFLNFIRVLWGSLTLWLTLFSTLFLGLNDIIFDLVNLFVLIMIFILLMNSLFKKHIENFLKFLILLCLLSSLFGHDFLVTLTWRIV